MFEKVIVGIDARDRGCDAIALAKLLAPEAQLTFTHVFLCETWSVRGSCPPFELTEREHARELLEQTQDASDTQAEAKFIGALSVGHGLHAAAEEIAADLIVVGSCRRSVFERVLLGDDARSALDGAPCAVAIAPAGFADGPHPLIEVGVGYDGSAESERALEFARELAAARGSRLSGFTAVSLPSYALMQTGFGTGDVIDEMIDSARGRLEELGVEAHAAYGDPPEELAFYSGSLSLLVVGSRGYGPLGRLVHGSTSRALTKTARCPLLLLPRTAHVAHHRKVERGDEARGELQQKELKAEYFENASVVS